MAFFIERPIPERPYFKVGEAAHILGVAPSTVRYWQKEFPNHIRAELSRSGQNVFSRCDVVVMAVILNLVRTDGMSIKDARSKLADIIAEHGGRIDRIPLCQQFELPLLGAAPAGILIEPLERAVPSAAPAVIVDAAAPLADGCAAGDVPAATPSAPPCPVESGGDNSANADPATLLEEIARMQAELDAQLAMNEFLAEDNRLLRATVEEMRQERRAVTEAVSTALRAILAEIDR